MPTPAPATPLASIYRERILEALRRFGLTPIALNFHAGDSLEIAPYSPTDSASPLPDIAGYGEREGHARLVALDWTWGITWPVGGSPYELDIDACDGTPVADLVQALTWLFANN